MPANPRRKSRRHSNSKLRDVLPQNSGVGSRPITPLCPVPSERMAAVYLSRPTTHPTVYRKRIKHIEGKPEVIELDKSSGFKLLDEAAQNTVKTWRFVPAKRGSNAVSAWVIVPIQFKINPINPDI